MRFGTRTWALLPLAVGLNVAVGQLVGALKLPLYLDSLGTVLVGALGGPAAGALTGALSNVLLAATMSLTWLPFAATSATVGALSGWLAACRLFSRPQTAALGGLLVGVASALVSAPIAAYLFGGLTGGGTDLVVALFRASGLGVVQASLAQGLLTDPLDKLLTFLLVQLSLASLPPRVLASFPAGAALGRLQGLRLGRPAPASTATARLQARSPALPPALFRPGQGWLHRRSPFTKLLLAGLALAAALTAPGGPGSGPGVALPLWAAAGLALGLSAGVGLEMAGALAGLWGPLALSLVLVNGLAGGLSPARALQGLTLSLRLLVALEGALLLLLTTRPAHLVGDLERRGLPAPLAYVLLSSLQLLPGLARRSRQILWAQTARGMASEGGLVLRLRALGPTVGPLVQGALAEVHERALALEARGFAALPRRTWLLDPPGSALDGWLQVLILGALVAVVLA
jgi:energy-coupling factor transport system substrate-specific component